MSTSAPPAGELALLFTDVEGSTRLAQRLREHWPAVLHQHRVISRRAWQQYGGHEVDTAGDGFFVVFAERGPAVAAAIAAQRALTAAAWPGDGAVRVRMGLHVGHVSSYDGSYIGYEVHRAARITAAAHGGQVLGSAAVAVGLVVPGEPGAGSVDLGRHLLKDLAEPEHLFQVTAPGLPTGFPPLRTPTGPDAAAAADVPSTFRNDVDVPPAVLRLPDGRPVAVTAYGLRVGRTPDNELVLADQAVSRHHCAISATNGGFILTDLQSTHGTHVNGVRIDAPRLLAGGDVLRVGDSELVFSWPV